MYGPFSEEVMHLELPIGPFVEGYNKNKKVTKNFKLYEFYDATLVYDKDSLLSTGLPMHKNIPQALQLIRDASGNSVGINAIYRSPEWEDSHGRDGSSQHTNALAVDFKGVGIVDLMKEAYDTKNKLYKDLKRLGVNAFGFYGSFVHLDFRGAKSNGADYFWDERKKKSDLAIWAVFLVLAIALRPFIERILKRIFR